ncbi:Npun_R2821/Npun_R2822 family protein [Anabaena lutea]|uniref:Sugar transferase n=1 Tax=Anabaena lutea FACHB-196 TaxID=2692881 RepID=A0ABR8FNJ0_9NOST|nr:Npun_R2821/Npun_R2822 family protein [Anabaena lutea]MBD2571118.1 sugar transferase [Anabaena lutea FACHB-196]
MVNGIYTLANDVVYDQLVALLNSIEVNAGREIPVYVIPYDDNIEKVKVEIDTRNNVNLFDDAASIARWEEFGSRVCKSHKRSQELMRKRGLPNNFRTQRYRKLCCLDGPFDKFIFFDGDTLLMKSLDEFYQKLDEYDWVTNDFQHKSDLNYIFNWTEEKITEVFQREKIINDVFCSGWFASKKCVFDDTMLANLLDKLESGEADVLHWIASDQTLLNYLVLRSGISSYNYACHDDATGSHWSSKFDVVDNILYDQGKPITYLHYMSISASSFTKLCAGEDVDIAYRDVFLHYRYLKSPEQRPQSFKRPSSLSQLQQATTGFVGQKIKNLKLKYRNLKDRIKQ